MAKEIKLDVKNVKLLSELEKDSRKPISQIAKRIKISKEVANYRIKNLIKKGLIKRFIPVIDYFALNHKFYRLIINLHNLKYYIRKNIIEELKKNKNIDLNVYLLSDWDLEINLWVKNSKEFYDFYNEFIEKYAEYIADKEFYIITKIYLFGHGYIHHNHRETILGEEKKIVEIDETDERIIGEIEENPKIEILRLAEKLHISPSKTNYRVKQLASKGILKCCIPIINQSLLGYNIYRIEITLNNTLKKKEAIEYLASNNHVTKITEMIGRKDMDFEVEFKTTADLDAFLEDLRLKVPYIKDFEVINVLLD